MEQTIKRVPATRLREDLKGYAEKVGRTEEPFVLVIHGDEIAAMVPVSWAEMLYQIVLFDNRDHDTDEMRAELRRTLEHSLAEALALPEFSLADLLRKMSERATTVHQFHNLQKSL